MPELPEVETTRRGIEPHILARTVTHVTVRNRQLRWPVDPQIDACLPGHRIDAVRRRGKYLLLQTQAGCLIVHLGMSGSLRMVSNDTPPQKHDHVDIVFSHGHSLRLRDPRRFGAMLWTTDAALQHPLLKHLGPEPWDPQFNPSYLFDRSRRRKQAIKPFIMDSHTVVGVGNIYASEALFLAGIHPKRAAGRVSQSRYETLVEAIQKVLEQAIAQGGTTLRDFVSGDGKPGYFQQALQVYGRETLPCLLCGHSIRQLRLGQRATYYCPQCQK